MNYKKLDFKIRPYVASDWQQVRQLFYDTVYAINARDYSPEQLEAIAPLNDEKKRMQASLETTYTLIAEKNNVVIGFANITNDGYIDHLYVHKDHQGQGVGSQLLKALEHKAQELGLQRLYTHASITARPFFEHAGYQVIEEQQIERNGIFLTNFVMEKLY